MLTIFSQLAPSGKLQRWDKGNNEDHTLSESQKKNDASSSKGMKVTDRRMFTPEGELRDEFRHVGEGVPAASAPSAAPAPLPTPEEPPAPEEPEEQGPEQPGFYDLVSLLAEHASVYLRQASMPGGDPDQTQELCKLHIDLLAVLKSKTTGNLDAREQAMLDDVLYRLRSAFTSQQRGF